MDLRIGTGYDIHKLVKNKTFILGNVIIPFKKGFLAHSDGDVLIHSIIEACSAPGISAISANCFLTLILFIKILIHHFYLKRTNEVVKNSGFTIVNIDSTIICQKPKLQKLYSRNKN